MESMLVDPQEEQVLTALKDLIAKGWKCDNGFKAGYQGMLEQILRQAFPCTTLRANPHINSKLHVWKKDYGSLSTMLSRSGFGWNESTHMVEVDTDDIWNEYVKTDSNTKAMRYKSWTYYLSWCEIFGKDRATGENAQVYVELVQDLLNKVQTANENATENQPDVSPVVEECTEAHSKYHELSNSSAKATTAKPTNKHKKKRKTPDNNHNNHGVIVNVFTQFCDKTDLRLSQMLERMGADQDARASRKAVFDALEKMHFLSLEDKISVSTKMCVKRDELDVFFSLSDDNKAVMVKMLLDGKL